jgi:hypothetical protein
MVVGFTTTYAVLKELLAALNKQLSEVQARMRLLDSNKLDIIVTTQ